MYQIVGPGLSSCMYPTVPDRSGRRAARRLALDLAILVGRPASLVVVAHPLDGTELARASSGHPAPVDGDMLLGLVHPSEPIVCDTARLHDAALRRLAAGWQAERVLVVPCVFGNDLVAVGVAPVHANADRRAIEVTARCLGDRFAAQVTATRLFANARQTDLRVAG